MTKVIALEAWKKEDARHNPVVGLRNIADNYEAGVYGDAPVTIVIGNRLFHLGTTGDQQSVMAALWDLEMGKRILMDATRELFDANP